MEVGCCYILVLDGLLGWATCHERLAWVAVVLVGFLDLCGFWMLVCWGKRGSRSTKVPRTVFQELQKPWFSVVQDLPILTTLATEARKIGS